MLGAARPLRRRLPALALLAGAWGCSPGAGSAAGQPWSERELALIYSLSPLPPCPPSPSNRLADDEQAARLGHALFFDPRLSGDRRVSCASCHQPALYFTDGRKTSNGIGPGERHTLSLVGAPWGAFFAWDGRKDSLWSQALGPIEQADEMGSHRLLAAALVRDSHRESYEQAFGTLDPLVERALAAAGTPRTAGEARAAWESLEPWAERAIDAFFADLGKAIEAYERKLLPAPAPFDDYVAALRAGDPQGAGRLSEAAVRGLRSFLGEAGCIHCHNGPLFTDFAFHNLGLPEPDGRAQPDPGRSRGLRALLDDPFRSDGAFSDARENPELLYLDADFADAVGAFKTPSLRNVSRTAPYGHAGQFGALRELLGFYRGGHSSAAIGHVDPLLAQVQPTFSVEDLLDFLETLTGPLPDARWLSAP